MQQASLLSYFSKPIASATPTPRDQVTASTIEPAQAEKHSAHESNGLVGSKIVSAIREQTFQTTVLPTTPRAEEDVDDQTKSCKIIKDSSSPSYKAPITGITIDSRRSSQYVTVAHLPEALISPVQQAHVPSIRRLTSTTLPVRYGDAFFTSTITDPQASQLSRVVLYASEPVGWIRCRLEPCSGGTSELSQIYIQALALLSPYRSLGLATMLLDAILASATAKSRQTVCVYAHVWEKNEDALLWYEKRGFKRIMLVDRYYRRLRPGGAWIVRRELENA